jgi:hypothetical protein
MVLAAFCAVGRAEKVQWYSGAFEENESGKKTSSSNIVGQEDDATGYVFGFASEKSNAAFAQFPIQPEKGKNAFSLEVMSKKDKVNAEIWIESSGWKFQGKIEIPPGKFSKHILPLKECKSDEVKWLRLIIPNKANPARGSLLLKTPVLCNAELPENRTWYTGKFNKADSCSQAAQSDGSVKFDWKFSADKPEPVFVMTKFNSKEDRKEFQISARNAGTQPLELEIWIENPSGWKFQGKFKVDSQKWETKKFALVKVKSPETKYLRLIAAPKGNPSAGAIFIKNPAYIK